MSKEELEKQVKTNKKRIISNNLFLGAISIAGLVIFPPFVIATVGVGAARTYWLSQNNKVIKDELNKK